MIELPPCQLFLLISLSDPVVFPPACDRGCTRAALT
jgi:hypothetical protein